MVWHRLHNRHEWKLMHGSKCVFPSHWDQTAASPGCRRPLSLAFFVLVYTGGRRAGLELTPIGADSLEVWVCAGLLTTQLDLHHHRRQDLALVFIRTTQGGPEYAFYQQSEDNFGLSSKIDYTNNVLCFYFFFFPRMPNESEISISFYNNIVSLNESTVGRPFWGNAEVPQRYSISLFNQLVCVRVGFFHLLVGAVHWALTKIKHHYVTLTKQIWINMSAGAGWQRGALSSTWNGRNNFLSSFSWHDGIDRVFSTARHGSGVDGPLTLGCICHSLTLELMWCLSQRRDELKQGNADSKSWLSGISATAVSH